MSLQSWAVETYLSACENRTRLIHVQAIVAKPHRTDGIEILSSYIDENVLYAPHC